MDESLSLHKSRGVSSTYPTNYYYYLGLSVNVLSFVCLRRHAQPGDKWRRIFRIYAGVTASLGTAARHYRWIVATAAAAASAACFSLVYRRVRKFADDATEQLVVR